MHISIRLTLLAFFLLAVPCFAREPINLPNQPALSPDGKTLAFSYAGDIWSVPTTGGVAQPLTRNPARDREPKFSPDGKEIAFTSDREGTSQVFIMPAQGGTPRQITSHTAGYDLQEWSPDGHHLLISANRDNAWRHGERFFQVNLDKPAAEKMLFDDYGSSGVLSPDGKKILFVREGIAWWRKGYKGSQAGQIWMYDLVSKEFTRLIKDEWGALWPLWKPDGSGFYFVSGRGGLYNLWEHQFTSGAERQITTFKDESVVFPCISRDGSTIVFRHLFDFYRIEPSRNEKPQRIEIYRDDDRAEDHLDRRVLDRATSVAFTDDGLEIAFIAGGDLWVMDTELREPRQVTSTPEEERNPVFSPDGKTLWFISDAQPNSKTEIWKATRMDASKPWWFNKGFHLQKVTHDGEAKQSLSFSPDGSKMAYIRGRGDFWVADADGKNAHALFTSWNAPSYDWSPDGKWIVYASYDEDFNRDIWIRPIDGSKPAFNISRHPYNEDDPVWSPDGRLIAFIGARDTKDNMDLFYVYLRAEDDQKGSRERTLEKALEKMKKSRVPGGAKKIGDNDPPEKAPDPREANAKAAPAKKNVEVVIDFEGIHDRIHRVTIPNSPKSEPFWSPDSKKLAFTAAIDGQAGTYTIEIPDGLKPTLLSSQTGTHARWLKGGQIVWLSAGLPGSIAGGAAAPVQAPTGGKSNAPFGRRGGGGAAAPAANTTPSVSGGYRFTALQEIDLARRNQAAFDMCWRLMRDEWYDDRLGNKNWLAVREKYFPVAETADGETLTSVVQMMLGELNGSHLGFTYGSTTRRGPAPEEPSGDTRHWLPVTAHLGVRFVDGYGGPGLKIRDVLPEGPSDHALTKLKPGEIVLSIDGKPVDPTMDITNALNGPLSRDIVLKVRDETGKEREVTIRPISYQATRALLYRKWLDDNRLAVDKLSKGKLGYLHISQMDMVSFHKFEEELYNAGSGKDGLVIDVRENGGGSTADLLMTALMQPRHAVAIPRGGVPGYPQDRTVFATWDKPVVVLCNQNSFSNAEIFSHAIKTVGRGKLVGVPTAGGVISTGGTTIMDVGFLRLPTRGWFLKDTGEDMELNGAVPDVIIWPEPGEMARGKDSQLAMGVETLLKDVDEWKKRPQPKLRKATER